MNQETFSENFELLADAPNGVQKLRELILQLAVKGKLVPQDPNEETASVLLEKIIADKERLIKEKKFKKSQTLPEIEKDEIPFDIPKTWKWIRLNDVGDWGAGSTPDRKRPDYYEGSILWFKSGELNDGYIYDSGEKITDDAFKDCSLRLNKPGDVLIAMYGATIGKVAILEVEATTNQAVCACTCFSGIYNCYLFYLLKAYRRNFSNQGAGGAQPNISRQKIIHTVAPIPPLEEQKRIVAKVDQLMALCDELEAHQQEKHEQRIRLNNAALDKLLTAPTLEEFAQHWQRICDNFDLLYDAPETVGQLRQAILQLAVQGKLVAQDEGNEPAAVLLDKIMIEKERLITEKKIPKSMIVPIIDRDDLPFDLPIGWKWCRWNDIAQKIGDVDHKMPIEKAEGIPYVSPRDFTKNNGINFHGSKKISIDDFERLKKKIQPENNDIIFPRYGTIGENRFVETNIKFLASYSCAVVKNMNGFIESKYSFYYSLSPLIKGEIEKYINKTTQPNVGIKSIKNFIFPLPPLEEQKRIVAKVDQLMTLCDELEAGLVQAQTDGGKLMEAVVHHVLAG